MTKHQLETMRLASLCEPTRARSVVRFLHDALEGDTPRNRKERRRQARHHRHPARTTSRGRRKHWHNPEIRKSEEFHARLRAKLERAKDEDGMYAGVLGELAAHAAVHLCGDFGLDPELHAAALEYWLTAKLGDVLREPDIDGYLAWRTACVEAVAA